LNKEEKMDFGFGPEEESFRKEVVTFIQREFPEDLRWRFGCTFTPSVNSSEGEDWDFIKAMRKKLGSKGWLSLSWPEKYGGRNSFILQNIVFEEMLYHNVPAIDHIGVTFFAPTLLRFGTEEQKNKYLPGIANGETFWCELLSEPDSGSDLASLKTTAAEHGKSYIINGQKTWTSAAHKAHMGFMLARTDSVLTRHRGLSYFIIDMSIPGISISPIIDMAGDHELNEVYFDNVIVPEENIVGGKNKGWYVTMMTLDFERFSHMLYPSVQGFLDQMVKYLGKTEGHLDINNERRLSQLSSECEMAKMIHYRAMDILSNGTPSTYEVAMDKMYNCELAQRAAELGMQILGPYGELRKGSPYAPLEGWPAFYYLDSASYTMMGGTSEIDRNVIASQGLGLPNE
jgi:3-oxocholest-4-en-26-oyl-CoA dehydrogenase alpha subunit